ncbi:eukaryotic translation initiation factor 4E-binding protein [Aethina tumida]|uniref:eukaryotic translation initiation factor 4E-binding protein n=1 Tax=Aethina tumida TaxID=116153 RepID=UPI00096AF8C7|nr:eukaryotic translation initiation factor 4E-binding protein [Aethina tumida]
MSASPFARQATDSKAIPTRKVFLNDPSELPSQYSSTPGGTLYSTTPGGTKIVYERNFLMNLKNSPISKTPPTYDIPENLLRGSPNRPSPRNGLHIPKKQYTTPKQNHHDEDQFQIEL